jgi:hypothetical protein
MSSFQPIEICLKISGTNIFTIESGVFTAGMRAWAFFKLKRVFALVAFSSVTCC